MLVQHFIRFVQMMSEVPGIICGRTKYALSNPNEYEYRIGRVLNRNRVETVGEWVRSQVPFRFSK